MMRTVLALAVTLLATHAVLARGPDVSPADYQLYMDWRDGREDPRLEAQSEEQKLARIAKSLNVKPADLKRVVERIDKVAATLAADTEKAIQQALAETALKGRVLEVHVDAGQGHVVAGLKWRCGDTRDADKEAAWAAWAANDGGRVVQTLVLWCVNDVDTKLFSAKIGRAGFEKVAKDGIERFATSRYIKLFEDVKRGPHA